MFSAKPCALHMACTGQPLFFALLRNQKKRKGVEEKISLLKTGKNSLFFNGGITNTQRVPV
jgi:hypothetical protein